MVPVCSPAQATGSQFPGSHLIRDLWLKRDVGAIVHEPEVNLMRLFASHAGIEHFRVEWNNRPLLLFADMEAKEYSSAWSYQNAKAVITTRQNVTMGLKKGNTVLLHFQYHGQLYQAILQMSSSVPGAKGGKDTHKLWKHVMPRPTDFAWLPQEIAETFCLAALQLDPNRPYGTLNQCVPAHSPRSKITVDQIYFIGESRSASELEVFINMPIERLRVGCGLQCTLPHVPLVPSSRPLLFSAAVKLLKFAMGCKGRCTNSPVEDALMEAMYPLLCNPDEHVLSTLGSLVLALLEGKTDLPISGVFGAGKTRSAAILVVGLLVFEPNLNLMILTKENVAAQAFAEHIEGLNMPQCVTSKTGRLVGYMELKKNRTKGTSLDVTCENRHEVLRQKRLLIGCGGGFQQELLEDADSNPYESEHMTAVTQLWCEIFGNERVWLDTVVCATCFAILWLALKGEGVSSPIATTLDAAAGLAQRQKWGLILPSSARVSMLTYQTVIGVRYPELVRPTTNGWQYGRYVSAEATLQGGFLPVFWDVPKSIMHAVSDVGALVEWLQEHIEFGQDSTDNLAVLHNQNHMVHEFGLSAWATQSGRQVISRSVTSCAGMTAYMVVVAQTKVGFLTWRTGRKIPVAS